MPIKLTTENTRVLIREMLSELVSFKVILLRVYAGTGCCWIQCCLSIIMFHIDPNDQGIPQINSSWPKIGI